MRRYFSILAVAMATIFLTACKLSNGDTPNPQRSNQLIWSRVSDGLYLEYGYMMPVAHLNDLMLGKEYASTAYGAYEMTDTNGEYTITYFYGGTLTKDIFRIVTDGKRLDEGGEWTLYVSDNRSDLSMQLIGTVKGFVGEVDKFILATGNPDWYRYNNFFVAQTTEVTYAYNEAESTFNVRMNSIDGVNTDNMRYPDSASYTIEYEVVRPLVWENGAIILGELKLCYHDLLIDSSRMLGVEFMGLGEYRYTNGR